MTTEAANAVYKAQARALAEAYTAPPASTEHMERRIHKALEAQKAAHRLHGITNCGTHRALGIAETLGPDLTNAITNRIAETGLTLAAIANTLGDTK